MLDSLDSSRLTVTNVQCVLNYFHYFATSSRCNVCVCVYVFIFHMLSPKSETNKHNHITWKQTIYPTLVIVNEEMGNFVSHNHCIIFTTFLIVYRYTNLRYCATHHTHTLLFSISLHTNAFQAGECTLKSCSFFTIDLPSSINSGRPLKQKTIKRQ